MAAAQLLLSLIVLSILSLSFALPTQTLINAAKILSDFGYTSMALTIDLDSQTLLLSQSSSLTIFALTDAAFSHSGQPSLNLLQFHIILIYFSLQSLKSLPFGTKISTLLSDHSLSVTILAYDPRVSLNNIPITVSLIFDDGSLIIFGIDRFLECAEVEMVLRYGFAS